MFQVISFGLDFINREFISAYASKTTSSWALIMKTFALIDCFAIVSDQTLRPLKFFGIRQIELAIERS